MKKLLFLLCVLLLAACAGPASPTEPPATLPPAPAGTLADTDWTLTLLRDRPLLAGTTISLEFEETTFGGSAGCNRYGGQYVAQGDGSLSRPTIELTAMLCTEPEGVMEQEKAYIDALVGAVAYRLSEDRLELQDTAGTTLLVYSRQDRAVMVPACLVGTAWRLVSLDGRTLAPDQDITLGFLDDRWLVGYGGCRGYSVAYQAAGSDLRVLSISMLGPDCPDAERLLPQEGDYTTLLEWVSAYRLGSGELELLTLRGESLLFGPVPPEAQATLEGPVWSLVALVEENRAEGMPVPLPQITSVISSTEITISFGGEAATGSAGCNTYQAPYAYDCSMVTFGPAAATERACLAPAGAMEQEQRYLKSLLYWTYQIVGSQLWARTLDGQTLIFTVSVPGTRPSAVPAGIVDAANQIVISRVGEAFFRAHWSFDPIGSRLIEPDPYCVQDPANCAPHLVEPYYTIAYTFRVPAPACLTAGADLALDASGTLIETAEMTGIPDCMRDPQECVFVDEAAAVSAARQAGLEPGLGEWRTDFHWYPAELNTYVWTVENTLTTDESTGASSGRTVTVDANSGVVLQILEHQVIP